MIFWHPSCDEAKAFLLANSVKDPVTGCRVWAQGHLPDGYGILMTETCRGVTRLAHRIAWMTFKGPIPDGMNVLHKCDNRPCIEEEHLYLGSLKDNTRDRQERNKDDGSRGTNNWSSKLTEDQVRAIRADTRPHRVIAAEYGVAHATIGKIRRGTGWSHLA